MALGDAQMGLGHYRASVLAYRSCPPLLQPNARHVLYIILLPVQGSLRAELDFDLSIAQSDA